MPPRIRRQKTGKNKKSSKPEWTKTTKNMEDASGWIESVDPTTGRTFYANRYTRTTQWNPPPGWKTTSSAAAATQNGADGRVANQISNGSTTAGNVLSDIASARRQMDTMGAGHRQSNSSTSGGHSMNGHHAMAKQPSHQHNVDDDALPDGWEEMTDPTTGRKFYIDHASKVTTWERPTERGSSSVSTNVHGNNMSSNEFAGFDAQSIMKLNQHGSHSHWDDDPHRGSNNRGHQNYQRQSSYQSQQSYAIGLSNGTSSSHPGPPPLDFVVVSVPDASRMDCPGCKATFTYTKRRHHCRLCGVSCCILHMYIIYVFY